MVAETSPLVETWQIHNRINLYLLEALDEDKLLVTLTKGRAVGAQFSHIHSVRMMWLKASAPDLLEGLSKLEAPLSISAISTALSESGKAVETLISRAEQGNHRVKNFKPHVSGFMGYLISHESHHRGQIEIALRQAGVPLSDKVSYGLWEWGVR